MRSLPSYDDLLTLPAGPRLAVPAEFGDPNGHVNVRHYLGLFDDAEWSFYEPLGLGETAAQAGAGGVFALEQHLTYRREVLVGEEVQVHLRLMARRGGLLHLVSYLANHTKREVAAAMEALEGWVDLSSRRLAPFPEASAAALDTHIAAASALPWSPELSATISLG